jgi:hypothetical protein
VDDSGRKYIALDSRFIDRADHVRLALGQVRKEARGALFIEEKPWEVRFDNLYANVIFDEEQQLYRCWYNPFIIDEVTSSTPLDRRTGLPYRPAKREMGVCYATSRDGLAWRKPELGLVELDGSAANNLVMRGVHGVGVTIDRHDPDPDRRYKAFMQGGAAASPDGLHWSGVLPCPEIDAAGDTHNNIFWDGRTGKYVGITRLWRDKQRIVGRTESQDFTHWAKAVEVMRALPDEPHRQTYALLAFPCATLYLGLVMLFDTQADTVDCELARSYDAMRWERACPGRSLIPRGDEGSFDSGCIYAAAYPISLDGQLRLYYGGSDGPHSGWRAGALGLAYLRQDGFAGLEASRDVPGAVTTVPLSCDGALLRVSADVGRGGALRVGVVDADGFTLGECQPITADVTDGIVKWGDGRDLNVLRGERVRLQFELRSAKLYSWRFG